MLSEGSRTGRLLFLIHGVVEVVKGDWVVARVSEMGAVFGEMAVLQGRPHTASVLAVQPSSFYVVDDAEAFLENEPPMALYVAVVQSRRIDAANDALIQARSQIAGSASGAACWSRCSIGSAAPCTHPPDGGRRRSVDRAWGTVSARGAVEAARWVAFDAALGAFLVRGESRERRGRFACCSAVATSWHPAQRSERRHLGVLATVGSRSAQPPAVGAA